MYYGRESRITFIEKVDEVEGMMSKFICCKIKLKTKPTATCSQPMIALQQCLQVTLTPLHHCQCNGCFWLPSMPVNWCFVAFNIFIFQTGNYAASKSCCNAIATVLWLSPCLCWLGSTVAVATGWLFSFNILYLLMTAPACQLMFALPPHAQLCSTLVW